LCLERTVGCKSTEVNDGLTVSCHYDGSNNRSETIWPDGYYVGYVYDSLNRMSTATEYASTGTTGVALYCYDALSRRTDLYLGAQGATCTSGTASTNDTVFTLIERSDGR
jgi:hypothetical protein